MTDQQSTQHEHDPRTCACGRKHSLGEQAVAMNGMVELHVITKILADHGVEATHEELTERYGDEFELMSAYGVLAGVSIALEFVSGELRERMASPSMMLLRVLDEARTKQLVQAWDTVRSVLKTLAENSEEIARARLNLWATEVGLPADQIPEVSPENLEKHLQLIREARAEVDAEGHGAV